MARQQLHTGLEGLLPEPGAEGGEVENDTKGIPRPPLVVKFSRAEELPTPPLGRTALVGNGETVGIP